MSYYAWVFIQILLCFLRPCIASSFLALHVGKKNTGMLHDVIFVFYLES